MHMQTYRIYGEVQHNMLHLLVGACEHIHQGFCRGAVDARNNVVWHVKSADSDGWLPYFQRLAHTLEGSQIVVIMEYI